MTLTPFLLSAASAGLLLAPAFSQVANEFDFDQTQRPLTVIAPNGPTHSIVTDVTYVDQNLVLHAPLVVRNGGQLVLLRSMLTLHGGLTIERGGRLTVIDSSFLVANTYSGQYPVRNDGGLLHTERAVFGVAEVGGHTHLASFLLLRGTWLARNTVVQGMATMISEGRHGWYGDPAFRGGSLFADGLYEGKGADAIHMSGMGDATLANGTMNVGLYFDASIAGQPSSSVVDLEARTPLTAVYGDPNAHEAVTLPIASAACRLELRNHRSRTWQFIAVEVTSNGPQQTVTLRNAADALVAVRATNLTGSPVLGGPWSSHYSEMPGLPSTTPPGFHRIPPSCSVGIGNVTFRSGNGPDDWNAIYGWGLYLQGAATNFSVTGPSLIGEALLYAGQLHLAGSRSYDMGVGASVFQVKNNASMTIDNATIGDLSRWQWYTGLVEVVDSGQCAITRARVGQLRLRAGSPGAAITAQNVVNVQNIVTDTSGGGSVQVVQASSSQSSDLQNVDLETPGSGVPYWSATGFGSALVGDSAPNTPGSASRELTVQSTPATLQKTLSLPPDTYVTAIASTKMLQSSGQPPQFVVGQGATGVGTALSTAANLWRPTLVPLYVVGQSGGGTYIGLYATGNSTLRLDDVRVRINSWWNLDNLANLGFEGGYRYKGPALSPATAPDSWAISGATSCDPDTVVRPGAAANSRSVRLSGLGQSVGIHKVLTFFRAGDVVTVTGWARAQSPNPGAVVQAMIGNGDLWYTAGNGQFVPMPCDGAWRSFTMTFTVPPNPTYTHIELGCWDYSATGPIVCWFDDINVSLQ